MAFCIRCGKRLADGEVCTCTSVTQTMNQQFNQQVVNQQFNQQEPNQQLYQQNFNYQESNAYNQSTSNPRSKGRNKLLWILPIVLGAILLTVIIFISSSSSHMDPVNDFVEKINSRRTNPMEIIGSMSPDFADDALNRVYQLMMKSDELKEEFADIEVFLEDMYDACDDEYDQWKLSFDMRSESKMGKEDLEDLQDSYEYFFESCEYGANDINEILSDEDEIDDLVDEIDIDVKDAKEILKAMRTYYTNYKDAKITEAYEVKGKFIVTADKETYKTNTVTYVVAKVKGDWVYCGMVDDYIDYFEDENSGCFNFIQNYLNNSYLRDFTDFGL